MKIDGTFRVLLCIFSTGLEPCCCTNVLIELRYNKEGRIKWHASDVFAAKSFVN